MELSRALDFGAKKIGRANATQILCHVTNKTRAQLYIHSNEVLPSNKRAQYEECLAKAAAGVPLQYVLSTWGFCGIHLKVDSRALIPRPETELLVQMAAEYIIAQPGALRVCDMCTGSGCIAIVLAEYADVVAVDISKAALELARENVLTCGVEGRVTLVESDLFADVPGTFDVIIANPPYIKTKDYASLAVEVLHEPRLALDGGADGCDIYRRLITQSVAKLNYGGKIFLEIGPQEVRDILHLAGYIGIREYNDLAGRPRILTGGKHVSEIKRT